MRSREEIVGSRLRNQAKFDMQRRKIHNLRRVVAGDVSPLGGAEQRADGEDGPDFASQASMLDDLYEILVADFDEGRSNKMLQSTRTLLMQTCFTSPTVDFEDLDDIDAALHGLYLKARLGPRPRGCAAMDQMRLALLDYLVGAVGWSFIALEGGIPVVRCVDALDVTWDTSVKLLPDVRWASVRIREPVWKWVEIYGTRKMASVLTELSTPSGDVDDALLSVEHYYDVEGEKGRYVVWPRVGGELADKPLEVSENPYTSSADGFERPFLPLDPCYHLSMPSVKFPVSFVEMMLPNQVAVWESEKYMREVVQRGKPFYEAEEGALGDDALSELMAGENGALVVRRKGSAPIVRQAGLEIPATLDGYHRYNTQEITSNGGADPSQLGRVTEAEFATQVAQVQQNSSLTAGMVAKDHTAHWERTIRKYLAAAVLYDDMPLTVVLDGTKVEFGPANPIGRFLAPDADVAIREDATQFAPKDAAIQRAAADLQVAMSVAQAFPNAVKEAYAAYLKAVGVRNPGKWLEASASPMPMAPDGLMPAGQAQAGQLV